MFVARPVRAAAAMLAVVALTLSGCGTTREQRIGTDTADACYQQRVALDATGDYFAEDMIKGAAVGAIGGAVLGLLIGGDATSAAIGAATGAIAGAAGGYWQARQQQAADKATLYNTVLSDVEREAARISETHLAFVQLVNCRKRQAEEVRTAYRSGALTRDQANARMSGLRDKAQGDLEIARLIREDIGERTEQLAYATYQIAPDAQQRVETRVTRAPVRPTASVARVEPPPRRPAPPRQTQTQTQAQAKPSLPPARAQQATEEKTVEMLVVEKTFDEDIQAYADVSAGSGWMSDVA